MAPGLMPNGIHGGMPLTEYSTNPILDSQKKTAASELVPAASLLPDGHPDVCRQLPLNLSMNDCLQYLRLILTSRVYDVVNETPLTHATNLSNRLECNVLLKREDLQPVFSFKLRGAYNKMAHLDSEQRWKGVVACSAGDWSNNPSPAFG